MAGKPSYSGSVGKLKFHVSCVYHGALGIGDTEDEAHKLAADHLRTRHTDSDKKVAANSDVQIAAIMHFTVADLENFPQG